MKFRCINAIVCLTIVVFFFILACDNGSVSDSGSGGLVKVSLAVDGEASGLQKTISVNSPSFTFWYKAVPQWIQDRPVHGTTNGQFILIPNGSAGNSNPLGYFTAGQWVFYIEVRSGSTPVYRGEAAVTISSASANITVNVAKIIEGATPGIVSINITAPTIDENTDKLTVIWSGTASGTATVTGTPAGSITTFSYETPNLAVGAYTFTFTHSNIASGTAVAVDLNQNQTAVISGSFDSGEWVAECVIFQIHSISVVKHNYGTDDDPVYYGEVYQHFTSAAKGDTVSFSVEPAQDSTLYEAPAVTCGGSPVACTSAGNHMYTFIMPDGDVTVHVRFTETDTDIDPELFMFYLYGLYAANEENVQAFGRSDTPPASGVEAVKIIKNMKMWFDGTNKICWYSSIDENRAKFKSGSLANLFQGRDKFLNISMKGLNTSKITDMSHMFDSCVNLRSVDLDGVSTASVTDMSYMFCRAGFNGNPSYETGVSAESQADNNWCLAISNVTFNTAEVTDMSYMFHACTVTDLSGINLKDWNVSIVTDMTSMFAGYSINTGSGGWKYWYNKFTTDSFINGTDEENNPINVLKNWNTKNVKYFSNMFCLCNKLVALNISGWKFNSAQYMDRMFERCEKLGLGVNNDPADDIKLVFPSYCDMRNLKSLLYLFGKDYEFRRENLAAIIGSWDLSNMPATTFSRIFDNASTAEDETIDYNNRVINHSNMFQNTGEHIRRNFRTRISIETYDHRTLWIGGVSSDNKYGTKYTRLTTVQTP